MQYVTFLQESIRHRNPSLLKAMYPHVFEHLKAVLFCKQQMVCGFDPTPWKTMQESLEGMLQKREGDSLRFWNAMRVVVG